MTRNVTIAGKYAGVEREITAGDDPGALAARISEYVRNEAKQGRKVSYAQAAAHVEMQTRGQSNAAQSLALRITGYMDEQRALGNRITYAEACSYVESHPEATAQRAVKAQSGKMDARSLADRISRHVAEQRALGNRITYAEACSYVESHPETREVKAQSGKMDARSLADRISQHVAEQRALGNRITYAEAAQYVESH